MRVILFPSLDSEKAKDDFEIAISNHNDKKSEIVHVVDSVTNGILMQTRDRVQTFCYAYLSVVLHTYTHTRKVRGREEKGDNDHVVSITVGHHLR